MRSAAEQSIGSRIRRCIGRCQVDGSQPPDRRASGALAGIAADDLHKLPKRAGFGSTCRQDFAVGRRSLPLLGEVGRCSSPAAWRSGAHEEVDCRHACMFSAVHTECYCASSFRPYFFFFAGQLGSERTRLSLKERRSGELGSLFSPHSAVGVVIRSTE